MNHSKLLRQDERTAELETFRRVEQMQRRNKSSRRDEKGPSSRERSSRSSNSGTLRCSRSQLEVREGDKNTSRGKKNGKSRQQLSRSRSAKQNGRDDNSGSKKEKSWSRSSSRNRSVRTKDGGNTSSNKESSSRGTSRSWTQTPPSNELSPTHSHWLHLSPVADFHRFDSMMKHVVQSNSPPQSQETRSKDKGVIVQKLRLPERTQKRLHEPRVHPQPRACSSPPCLITSVEDAVASRRKESCVDMDMIQDAAISTSRLKELCMDIIQSAKEGTSPPQRAKIKEIVTQYHKSHHQAISPRDPNFTEIPPEYSRVLTYGLARSQTVQVQRSNVDMGCTGSRSRFREIKDD